MKISCQVKKTYPINVVQNSSRLCDYRAVKSTRRQNGFIILQVHSGRWRVSGARRGTTYRHRLDTGPVHAAADPPKYDSAYVIRGNIYFFLARSTAPAHVRSMRGPGKIALLGQWGLLAGSGLFCGRVPSVRNKENSPFAL